jgi:hypothetical protein
MPPRPMTAKPRVATPLTRKLNRLVTLAPGEVGILDDLQSTTRIIRRNREIVTEGRKYDTLKGYRSAAAFSTMAVARY